jgi:hypothetical protein
MEKFFGKAIFKIVIFLEKFSEAIVGPYLKKRHGGTTGGG